MHSHISHRQLRNFIFPITIISSILLSSCSQVDDKEGAIVYKINPENVKNAGFSELYELEKLIRLENHPDSYFGDARKIIISNDKIYIHPWGQPRVIIFDINGKFIGKIENYGRGPGEFTYVVDISVSSRGDTICLYEKNLKQFMYYDLHGNFLNSVETSVDLESFIVLPDRNIVGYSFLNRVPELQENQYRLWLINPAGKLIDGLLPVKTQYLGNSIGLSSSLHQNNEGLFFIPYTENMIYEINQDTFQLIPRYYLDLIGNTIPANLLELPVNEMQEILFKESSIPYSEIIGKKYIIIKFLYRKAAKPLTAIIKKNNNSYYLFDSRYINDSKNELSLHVVQQYDDGPGGKLITLIPPHSVLQYEYNDQDSHGYKLSKELSDTDNPVIAVYSER
ncbi:MAG: 6-bladed beta-propeller [Bacteroidales bacterium]|nr:6-bladed beta-propeller [Bacteroidales bacterium]